MDRRVVITGIGVVSPIGVGVDAFWSAARAGRSGIGPISRFDATQLPVRVAGEVDDRELARWPEFDRPGRYARATRFALAAARLAHEHAGLTPRSDDVGSAGIYFGTAEGGGPDSEESYAAFFEQGWRRVPPATVPRTMTNTIAGHLAIDAGVRGPNVTIANACGSSAEAAALAFDAIRAGRLDIALTGGAESMLFPGLMAAWCRLRALSTRDCEPTIASRPFDRDRDGMVMAEGAAVLMLEDRERALRRGATIHAEIRGAASRCDASHILAPCADGQARTIRAALADAAIDAERVDYVAAHGTSTRLNDPTETRALRQALGAHAERTPVSALKSMTGHTIGAAGALQLAATALSLRDGWIHPTINLDAPDPDCDLDYVPRVGRAAPLAIALSNHFSFGGANTVLVLGRDDADGTARPPRPGASSRIGHPPPAGIVRPGRLPRRG